MLTDIQKNTLKTELLKMKEQASERKEDTSPKASMKETSGEFLPCMIIIQRFQVQYCMRERKT